MVQVKAKVSNDNNRKKWFDYLFEKYKVTADEVADGLGIKKDSFYKKIAGINAFLEKDIDYILKVLNEKIQDDNKLTYEYVFKKEV